MLWGIISEGENALIGTAPYTVESFDRQKSLLKDKLIEIGVKASEAELSKITFLSRRKYDRYDHFAQGETFEHRLINWLKINFEAAEFRAALDIVNSIEFVGEYELKDLAMRTFLKSELTILSETPASNTEDWNTFLDDRKRIVEKELQSSLFVALADDIAFDYLRRFAFKRHKFKKDNFIEYYKINEASFIELPEFKRVFLVDQLCGSGTTALRKDKEKWSGKIPRFYEIWNRMLKGKRVYYSPYIISSVAEKRMNPDLQAFSSEHPEIITELTPTNVIQISSCLIGDEKNVIDESTPVSRLCQKYLSKVKIDKNMEVGGNPTYGFGRAGLTLVFQSNCPNNTIPILWNSDNNWYPLFPRVKHHAEV